MCGVNVSSSANSVKISDPRGYEYYWSCDGFNCLDHVEPPHGDSAVSVAMRLVISNTVLSIIMMYCNVFRSARRMRKIIGSTVVV